MEKQTSDEYTSRLKTYDELVLGNPTVLEIAIARMTSNFQLIEFYDYCMEKVEAEEENCEHYWFASLCLEEKPAVRMYKNGQLYVDTTLAGVDAEYALDEGMTLEEIAQLNETIQLLEQRKKDKKNPFKQLLRNIRGR